MFQQIICSASIQINSNRDIQKGQAIRLLLSFSNKNTKIIPQRPNSRVFSLFSSTFFVSNNLRKNKSPRNNDFPLFPGLISSC